MYFFFFNKTATTEFYTYYTLIPDTTLFRSVLRVTAYHRTERDDAVETAVEQQLRSQRNLVGAGRAKEFDMLAGHAPGLQGGTRASDQRLDDLDIPARRDNHASLIGELHCPPFVGRR